MGLFGTVVGSGVPPRQGAQIKIIREPFDRNNFRTKQYEYFVFLRQN
jgi:hypothetical protein